MRPLCLLLTLGCATPSLEARHQSPPPGAGGLTLQALGTLEAGSSLTLRVTGANPGATILLARSANQRPAASCPPPLGGLCLDLVSPVVLATLTADGLGRAQRTVTLPATLPDGLVAWFQAAQPGASPATSAAIPRFNPRNTAAFAVRRDIQRATVVPGAAFTGTLETSWISIYDPTVDVCRISLRATGSTPTAPAPCFGCTFSFDVLHDLPTETSLAGDCDLLLGLDPASVPPFTDRIGLHEGYMFSGYGPYLAALAWNPASATWDPFAVGNDVAWDGSQFSWRLQGAYYAY
jgi:hypothetical protein